VERISKANHDLLGPLFYRFLFKLYLTQVAYDSNDTAILFLARGGLRIRAYYQRFLEANKLESPIPYWDFYVSRMALIKASMISHYENIKNDFLTEYCQFSPGEVVSSFWGKPVYDAWVNMPGARDPHIYLDQDSLNALLWTDSESSDFLRRILLDQQKLYFEYLNEIIGGKKNLITVDTGWSGSIFNYMQSLDNEHNYTGQYFGRYSYGKGELPWFNKLIGVEVEAPNFNRKKPVTALFLNRHLIEGLCEIRWPSVTGYQRLENGRSGPIEGLASEEFVLPLPEEPQAYGVMRYISEAKDGIDIQKIHESGENAVGQLCRKLMYPSKEDLEIFSVETRSADFGKNLDVPVFIAPIRDVFDLKLKVENIKNSLWPVGQITLEFPKTHRIIQFLYHRRYWFLGLFRRFVPNLI
jgi:hypothetical protein